MSNFWVLLSLALGVLLLQALTLLLVALASLRSRMRAALQAVRDAMRRWHEAASTVVEAGARAGVGSDAVMAAREALGELGRLLSLRSGGTDAQEVEALRGGWGMALNAMAHFRGAVQLLPWEAPGRDTLMLPLDGPQVRVEQLIGLQVEAVALYHERLESAPVRWVARWCGFLRGAAW